MGCPFLPACVPYLAFFFGFSFNNNNKFLFCFFLVWGWHFYLFWVTLLVFRLFYLFFFLMSSTTTFAYTLINDCYEFSEIYYILAL